MKSYYILQHAFSVSYAQGDELKVMVVNTFQNSLAEAEKRFHAEAMSLPSGIELIAATYLGECAHVQERNPTADDFTPIPPPSVEMSEHLRAALIDRPDAERLDIIRGADFCLHCGSDTKDGACHCWNDE